MVYLEHQPVASMGRTGNDSRQYANRPIPRGVDQGPVASTIGAMGSSNTTFATIGEREDADKQRYASSATNTHDGLRQERQRIKAGNFTPEEGAQASRHLNVTRRGSRAGADPSYHVPLPPVTGRDRDRVSALGQERDRHQSYTNIDTSSSIPALSSSATYNPGYAAPVNVPPVSTIISTMKSVSLDDNGERSNSSPHGRNGPSRAQVSSTRPNVLPPHGIRPTVTKKSVSFDTQPSTSLKDRNGPPDMQGPYTYPRDVPPPSSSRPIVPKKSVSYDSGSFQPSSSRKGWTGPSRLPCETYQEPSHFSEVEAINSTMKSFLFDDSSELSNSSPHGRTGPWHLPSDSNHEPSHFSGTTNEVPQSWQSSNRVHSQHSLPDIASGNPHYPVQPTDTHHKVSEGEYNQTLNRSWNEAQHREREMRIYKEEETKRKEDEITRLDVLVKKDVKVKREGQTQRMERPTRHVENAARRFDEDERRPGQMLQAEKYLEDAVSRVEEARLKGVATRAREEEIRRKEEERKRWEEFHSLKDLTHEIHGRSSYPIASGGSGDIWKCVLVKPSRATQATVAVKTIRAFETDNKDVVRKKVTRLCRELKVWGRLKHDSILPLWGVANDFGPYPAMVCPWADNGALTGFLECQKDSLSSRDKFSLLNDIALGLQYLHNESVVHGDLTGSNVLINGKGRACLADFGLSTIIVEFVGTSYFTTTVWGNVRWGAMELYETPDNASLTTACDVYSFGSIILQILTCKVPYYYVKNDITVLGQVIKGIKPEPPKELQIAPGHWDFIQRCWLSRASRPTVGEIVKFVGYERRALSY